MVDIPAIQEQILEELVLLTPGQQQELLDFARMLSAKKMPGVLSREELMQFVGSIPTNDLKLMEQAIEEECERIDLVTWDIELP